MSKKVDFTAMEEGTRSDYDLVFEHDAENGRNLLINNKQVTG